MLCICFSLQCKHQSGMGFRAGAYNCVCADGFYFPLNRSTTFLLYNGSMVESAYKNLLLNLSDNYNVNYQCLPCAKGCDTCADDSPCLVDYDVMMRGIPLGFQSFCMTISMVVGVIIIRLRKSKVSA